MTNKIYTIMPLTTKKAIIIDESLANSIIYSAKKLVIYCGIIDGYMIAKQNLSELENKIKYYEENNISDKANFREINRLTINFLSTFLFFINYCEKNINSDFDIIKQKYYDRYFEYRLFYTLRNHSLHSNYCIVEIKKTTYEHKNFFELIIKTQDLINNTHLNKRFINEIKNMNTEKIILNTLFKNFKKILFNLLLDILNSLSKKILLNFSTILSNIPNFHTDKKDAFLCINTRPTLSLLKMPNRLLSSLYEDVIQKSPNQEYKINLYNNISELHKSLHEFYHN
jgi:hypothetical protein